MDEDKKYTIKITGKGYGIEDVINKTQLGRILSIVTSNVDLPTSEASPSAPMRRHSAKRRLKTNLSSPVLVRSELDDLQLDPVSALYGNYWTIKTKSDRLMWILAVLSENNFESVNQKEMASFAIKLGDNIPSKAITSLLNTHKKSGRIAPTLAGTVRTIRILKPGLDYVKNLSSKGDENE